MSLQNVHEAGSYGTVMEMNSNIVGLDHNSKNHHTYFLSDNRVYFSYEKPVCLIEGLNKGINVAVDWVTDNVYFAEEHEASLGFCSWSGRYCTVFPLGDLENVRGLCLHPKRG